MHESEAIEQLEELTISLEELESRGQSVKQKFDNAVGRNPKLRYRTLALLADIKSKLFHADKLVYFFSLPERLKSMSEQLQLRYLAKANQLCLRLKNLVSVLKEVESFLTRKNLEYDVTKMSREVIASRIRLLEKNPGLANPESEFKMYLEVLEQRLSEIDEPG